MYKTSRWHNFKSKFMEWFDMHFRPKTYIKKVEAADFLSDYNNEMFWQQQNSK